MRPSDCFILSQTDDSILCMTPPGIGKNLLVTLSIGHSIHDMTYANMSYDSPLVTFLHLSRGGDAMGSETIKIFGKNFGPFRASAEVFIDHSVSCADAVWLADDPLINYDPYIQCITKPMKVGVHNLSLSVNGIFSTSRSLLQVFCKRGYFGSDQEYCSSCGVSSISGMICDQDNMYLPVSMPGFYITMDTVPSILCPPESQSMRDRCPASVACMPSHACIGDNLCSAAYSGERCASCAAGYYKINSSCQVCPKIAWIIPLIAALLLFASAIIVYLLRNMNACLGVISIFIDYFQILSVFSSLGIPWPQYLISIFNGISTINFNVDAFSPECYNNHFNISFRTKWILISSLPIVVFIILAIIFVQYAAFLKFVKNKSSCSNFGFRCIGAYIIFFYYSYLMLSENSLKIFNCQPTVPSDGNLYMSAVGINGGICYQSGSLQQELYPWAVLTFLLYSLGFPLAIAIILYNNRQKVITDQLIKASENTFSDSEAQNIVKFRVIFDRMYYQFKPRYYYWILFVITRKFLLSVCAVMFRGNIIFLLAVYLLVAFIAFTIQVKCSPYMSMSEHHRTILEDSSLLSECDQDMFIRSNKLIRGKAVKNVKLGDESQIVRIHRPKLEFVNNYNTVEGLLLAIIILITIGTHCFNFYKWYKF